MAKQDTDPDVFTEATSMYQRKEDVELDVIYFVSYPKACGGEACSAGQGFLLQGCGGEGAVGWQSRHLGFECWARAWAGVSRSW